MKVLVKNTMTAAEFQQMSKKGEVKQKKKRNHPESELQQACIEYFDAQYPKYRLNLLAIANGGSRSKTEAAIMHGEGVRAGASDLLLAIRGHTVFIEMKAGKGKQSPAQILFQEAIEKEGHKYVVIWSVDEFVELMNGYLKQKR